LSKPNYNYAAARYATCSGLRRIRKTRAEKRKEFEKYTLVSFISIKRKDYYGVSYAELFGNR
jgi:hypothetical protein